MLRPSAPHSRYLAECDRPPQHWDEHGPDERNVANAIARGEWTDQPKQSPNGRKPKVSNRAQSASLGSCRSSVLLLVQSRCAGSDPAVTTAVRSGRPAGCSPASDDSPLGIRSRRQEAGREGDLSGRLGGILSIGYKFTPSVVPTRPRSARAASPCPSRPAVPSASRRNMGESSQVPG